MFQKKTEKQQKPKKLRVYTVNSRKPAEMCIRDRDMMIEELNCLCQMVDELPESVQKNIETLLMEYGNVRNLYEHFVTNQNPVL